MRRTVGWTALLFFMFAAQLCTAAPMTLVTGEWAPYVSEKMENHGFFPQLVTAVFKELEIEVTYQFLPWKRCEFMVRDGEVFAAFPYRVTME